MHFQRVEMLLSSLLQQICEPDWIINLSVEALWDCCVFNHLMSPSQFGPQHIHTQDTSTKT